MFYSEEKYLRKHWNLTCLCVSTLNEAGEVAMVTKRDQTSVCVRFHGDCQSQFEWEIL